MHVLPGVLSDQERGLGSLEPKFTACGCWVFPKNKLLLTSKSSFQLHFLGGKMNFETDSHILRMNLNF